MTQLEKLNTKVGVLMWICIASVGVFLFVISIGMIVELVD